MRRVDQLRVQLHFAVGTCFEPHHRQLFGRDDLVPVSGAQHAHEGHVFRVIDTVRMPERIGCIDADAPRLARLDDIGECIPLIGKFLHVPRRLDRFANVVARNGQLLVFSGLRIAVEHKNGPAPRAEPLGGQHGFQHRVFVVFARDEDPHVDPAFLHERGEQGVEPFVQYVIDDARLLTYWQGLGIERTGCEAKQEYQKFFHGRPFLESTSLASERRE